MYESGWYHPMKNFKTIFYMLCAAILFLVVVVVPVYNGFIKVEEVTITVTSTDRTKDKWMVLGINEEGEPVALENTDNLFRLKFNSSDLQAGIQVGKTYTFRIAGIRNSLFSLYPNVLSVTPIAEITK